MAIRTIVWGENIHEQTNAVVRSIYPNGMHNTIADALNRDPAITAYLDREEARRDVFDYIERFYNPKRRHDHANDVSPLEFENQYFNRLKSV